MTSIARRVGTELLKLLKSAADPGAEADRALLYTKLVGTVSQLFARPSNGIVYQLTPFGGGSGAAMLYGTGVDGNVTIAAGTTTLARDMFYDTLTIQTGGILDPGSCRIFAKTAIIMQGTGKIAQNAVNGSSPGAGGAGAGVGSGVPLTSTIGKNGGAGNVATPGTPGTNSATGAPGHTMAGGAGGAGTTAGGIGGVFSANTTAAQGGLALALWAINARVSGVTTFNGSPGGGGGGGTAGLASGGGGGGGAAYVVVCAPKITAAGRIESKGGNGGNATAGSGAAGGGGGGAGGVIVCVCGDGNFPTLDVSGGIHGTAVNGGVNGSDGQAGRTYQYSGI